MCKVQTSMHVYRMNWKRQNFSSPSSPPVCSLETTLFLDTNITLFTSLKNVFTSKWSRGKIADSWQTKYPLHKAKVASSKTMICMWWDCEGINHYKMLGNNECHSEISANALIQRANQTEMISFAPMLPVGPKMLFKCLVGKYFLDLARSDYYISGSFPDVVRVVSFSNDV